MLDKLPSFGELGVRCCQAKTSKKAEPEQKLTAEDVFEDDVDFVTEADEVREVTAPEYDDIEGDEEEEDKDEAGEEEQDGDQGSEDEDDEDQERQ